MKLEVPEFDGFEVEVSNVTKEECNRIRYLLREYMEDDSTKGRRAIANTFLKAVELCPHANPSDLWHHIIYREYLRVKGGLRPDNSWVRTSGEGYEIMLAEYYNPKIKSHDVRLTTQFKNKEKSLDRLGAEIKENVGSSKIDLLVEKKGVGRGQGSDGYGIIGVVHAKASLAERVSDDVPASRILMDEGLFSILATLDVKSFPPTSGGDLVNRGELGTPEDPSDKRKYVEEHGDFSACFSWNHRTTPSPGPTPSGSKIKTVHLDDSPDAFTSYLRQLQAR
jgi:hypothetical protein